MKVSKAVEKILREARGREDFARKFAPLNLSFGRTVWRLLKDSIKQENEAEK